MMGETIPKETSYITLNDQLMDSWGVPLLKINVSCDNNDEKMRKDYHSKPLPDL